MKRVRFGIALLGAIILSACNSTDSTLGVDPAQNAQASTPAPETPAVTAPKDAATATVRMRFAPVIGAPVDKVTSLSRRITLRAKEQKFAIVASTDQTATHVLKGYFSVLGDGPSTTVIYVFDVLDPAGNRLHRIQGQELVAGTNAADAWAAVPSTLMESIADKVMTGFGEWQRSGQTG